MDGWKIRALKNKSFADIQDLFNKEMKRVNMFMDMDTELVESSKKTKEIAQEGSLKRAGDELEQEIAKNHCQYMPLINETAKDQGRFDDQEMFDTEEKGKGIMIEPEMPLKKKAQISLEEELAFKLQAKEDEQERENVKKTSQIEEVNLAWDDIQAKVDADYELAQRL
nr:hypothetical protein [Tanacetum cinerariifolium]